MYRAQQRTQNMKKLSLKIHAKIENCIECMHCCVILKRDNTIVLISNVLCYRYLVLHRNTDIYPISGRYCYAQTIPEFISILYQDFMTFHFRHSQADGSYHIFPMSDRFMYCDLTMRYFYK